MNAVLDPWSAPTGDLSPAQPEKLTKTARILLGTGTVVCVAALGLVVYSLAAASGLDGSCSAQAERDFETHRRDVLPLLTEVEPGSVQFLNDCDSGGGAATLLATPEGVAQGEALLGLRQAGWTLLDPEELDLTAVDAAITQRIDGTQVIVFADKRPDDNTVTEITIQSRH